MGITGLLDKKLYGLGFEMKFENRTGVSYIRLLKGDEKNPYIYSQRVDLEWAPDGSDYVIHSYRLGGSCGLGSTHCSHELSFREFKLFYHVSRVMKVKWALHKMIFRVKRPFRAIKMSFRVKRVFYKFFRKEGK